MEGLSADFRDPTPTGGAGYDFFLSFFVVLFRIGRDLFILIFLFFSFFFLLGVQSGLVGFHFYISLPVVWLPIDEFWPPKTGIEGPAPLLLCLFLTLS
jgi:hypothetical protein